MYHIVSILKANINLGIFVKWAVQKHTLQKKRHDNSAIRCKIKVNQEEEYIDFIREPL